MPDNNPLGLVGRVREVLGRTPAGFRFGESDALSGATTGPERRVRLALRIATLQAGPPPKVLPLEVVAPPPVVPEVTVPPPPEPPPPPRPKPARVSMSTVRLEDAAFLLAAASAPPEPVHQAVAEKPKQREGAKVNDLSDAFAAFSVLGDAAPDVVPEPAPPSEPMEDVPPLPAPEKARRRSGAVSAADAMANAAATLAFMQMDEPDPAPPADQIEDVPAPAAPAKAKRRSGSVSAADAMANAAAALASMQMDGADDASPSDPMEDVPPPPAAPAKAKRRSGSVSAADAMANAAAALASMQMDGADDASPDKTPSPAEAAMAAGFAALGGTDPD